jgi:REP element-mobilizing transposase RayT
MGTATRFWAGTSAAICHISTPPASLNSSPSCSTTPFRPHAVRREWEGILKEAEDSQRRRKLEAWLDRGHGECWLRRAKIAALVEEKLRERDGEAYRLQAWVVMPNHVHLVVDVWATPLSKLLNFWKGASARAANLALRRSGRFWERECFDTLIRDRAHLKRAVRYTENNPVKAAFVPERKDWRWASARQRDEYERLPPHLGRPAA